MERFDIAIVGNGPAGVSAALTAKNRNKSILLFGTAGGSPKVGRSEKILNYPGVPAVTGAELVRLFGEQLQARGIAAREERVSAVYAMGDHFALQAGQNFYEAGAVILTGGASTGKTIPGEEELLGHGVSYCATCDAALYRGRRPCVIAYSAAEESEAAFLAETAENVLFLPMYRGEINLPENVEIRRLTPERLEPADPRDPRQGVRILTKEQGEIVRDGVFVLRESIAPDRLVAGLKTTGASIDVNRGMETNLPGCFAAGDITGTPYQIAKAVGEGCVAALSAAAWLDKQKRKENQE